MTGPVRATTAARRTRQAVLIYSLFAGVALSPTIAEAQGAARPDPEVVNPRLDPQVDKKKDDDSQDPSIRPITPAERRDWMVDGMVGPKTLGMAVASATFRTAINSPEEWTGSSGFAQLLKG